MRAPYAIVTTVYLPQNPEVADARIVAAQKSLESWAMLSPTTLVTAVVDDGSVYKRTAAGLLRAAVPDTHTKVIVTPRLGCASALRAGARYVVENDLADVIFYAQDDWELTEPLDLAPSLGLIRAGYADVVRLGPTHPNLSGSVFRTEVEGAEWCLAYRWDGGGYVVGWRPALYRASLLADSLDDLDGLSAIEGERRWLDNMNFKMPRVFHAPNCTLAGPFVHLDTVELGEDAPAVLDVRYGS